MIVYKYKSLDHFDRVFDIIVNEKLYCPTYCELNDPFEGEFIHYYNTARAGSSSCGNARTGKDSGNWKILKDNKARICSFSQNYHDIKMWSFYADSHKGICIEIDLDGYSEDELRVIKYDLSPKIVSKEVLSERTIKNILSRKSDLWAYEQEVRLFSESEYHKIRGKIRRVLLGDRCSTLDEEMIKKIYPKNQVHRVQISSDYKVRIKNEVDLFN